MECKIHINSKLQWSIQCQIIAEETTRVLNILYCACRGRFRAVVRLLQYACVVWSPHRTATYWEWCNLVGSCSEMFCTVGLYYLLGPNHMFLVHFPCCMGLEVVFTYIAYQRDYLSVCTLLNFCNKVPFLTFLNYVLYLQKGIKISVLSCKWVLLWLITYSLRRKIWSSEITAKSLPKEGEG